MLVALLAGLTAGAVFALAAGARRTASSPDRYTEALGGDPELGLYQPSGPPLTEVIADLPDVRQVAGITFVAAFPVGSDGDEVELNPFAGDDRVLGSIVEGRFTDPNASDEFTVNRIAAEVLDLAVGDRVEVNSYSAEQVEQNAFVPGVPLEGPAFEATLVGVTESPSDLDDPQPTLVFSQAMLRAQPDVGVVASILGVWPRPGVTSAALLEEIRAVSGGLEVFEAEARTVSDGARRAIRLHTDALWIVTAVAAVVAALILVQLAARQRKAGGADEEALRALGYSRSQLMAESALEAMVIGVAASVVAVAVAVACSGLFPIGVLRTVEPNVGLSIDWSTMLVGSLGIIVVLVVAGVVTGMRSARRSRALGRGPSRLPELVAAAGAGPSMVNGVRFAATSGGTGRARPIAVAVSIVVAIAGLAGSLLVAGSLVRMIDEPALWGADFDARFGNPFTPTERDLVTPAAADPDVAGLTAATFGSVTLDGTDVSVVAFESVRGGILPVLLEGRVPAAIDEIALGRVVARDLDRSTGDTVTATGADGTDHQLQVVGYTTTAADAGDGASMTFDAYLALVPDATRNLLFVDYREGADRGAVADRLAEVTYTPPDNTGAPPPVLAFDRVVPAPYALALVLSVMAAAALGYHLTSTVRRRTRDLAILRALGADRRQLRATVHWQACFVSLVGLLIGVPTGLAIGSRIHHAIADSVGVVPSVALPVVLVLAIVVGVLVIANIAAVAPARRATRAPAAIVLQESIGAER